MPLKSKADVCCMLMMTFHLQCWPYLYYNLNYVKQCNNVWKVLITEAFCKCFVRCLCTGAVALFRRSCQISLKVNLLYLRVTEFFVLLLLLLDFMSELFAFFFIIPGLASVTELPDLSKDSL